MGYRQDLSAKLLELADALQSLSDTDRAPTTTALRLVADLDELAQGDLNAAIARALTEAE